MKVNFYQKLNQLSKKGNNLVVSTVISADNEYKILKGEKFILVDNDHLEYSNEKNKEKINCLIKEIGKKTLLNFDNPQLKTLKIDDSNLKVYLEPVVDNPRLILFGAGHIANSVSKVASLMDFEITVIDDRKEFLNRERFPEIDHLILKSYKNYLSEYKVEKNDYIVILTRGHQFDYDVLREVIDKNCKYIGMIGSSKKVKEVYDRLKEVDNINDQLLKSIHSPIGLAIGAETTAEIAVAIIAEIIKIRRAKDE
ncbi:MAG: XdhC family protein [Halanaerobiales bacterium]|nr:XdhC family protein [Halanaerobiales bacterium]